MWRTLACLSLFMMVACGSNELTPAISETTTDAKASVPVERPHLANIKRRDIPLDQNDPQAKVSLARNIYFIFDASGSMADPLDKDCGGSQEFPNKLEGAQWALAEFLKKIPAQIRIGLLIFDNYGSREVVPLGIDNREAFLQAIQNCRAGGGTPLGRAIRFGAEKLAKQYQRQLGYGEYRIVVVTDGLAKNIPDASVYAMGYGFPIYAIGLCVAQNHPLREYALSYRAADSFEDLGRGLEETLAELPVYDVQTFDEQP